MGESQIISWIFLSIALASQKEPTDLKGVSMVADGINHAIPTQKEIKLSISWLLTNKLIEEKKSKYALTKNWLIGYGFASLKTNIILEIWKNLERQIQNKTS